jgi:hypothetical protein
MREDIERICETKITVFCIPTAWNLESECRRVLYLEAVPPNVDFWNKINMYVCMLLWNIGMNTAFMRQKTVLFVVTPWRTTNSIFARCLK